MSVKSQSRSTTNKNRSCTLLTHPSLLPRLNLTLACSPSTGCNSFRHFTGCSHFRWDPCGITSPASKPSPSWVHLSMQVLPWACLQHRLSMGTQPPEHTRTAWVEGNTLLCRLMATPYCYLDKPYCWRVKKPLTILCCSVVPFFSLLQLKVVEKWLNFSRQSIILQTFLHSSPH